MNRAEEYTPAEIRRAGFHLPASRLEGEGEGWRHP